MPIKFKCKCGQVLSVPDTMAGKTGKCPKCKDPLKVPKPASAAAPPAGAGASKQASGGKPSSGKPSSGKPSAAKQAAARAAAGAATVAGGLDSLFDDAGLVEKTGPVCPNCAADLKPGTVVCTSCGMNFESGEMLSGFDAAREQGPEFKNAYLQQASDNMQRDTVMDSRRDKAAMPWWVLMSYLIGAVTLCAAGVIIVDGQFGTPDAETTFIGKVQRLSVFSVIGLTALTTGLAITTFAWMSICVFAFARHIGHGLACFFFLLLYAIPYAVMNWSENKAPVKAIISAIVFIGFGVFLIMQGGGFGPVKALF